GDHRKENVIDYFMTCLPFRNNNTIFIFDDIHWSVDMEDAWKIIKKHPEVKVTIDLFQLGVVFFRTELSKQDFVIKF
ncbi:MAG: SAM-dependent methyltransferase, partial [Bacteroidales bacterium]